MLLFSLRVSFRIVSIAAVSTWTITLRWEKKPDIILLDILMPKMDGLSMLRKLRQEGAYGKTVPVILLTNLNADSEETIRSIAETEPVYYIVKSSLSIQEVVARVRDCLERL